VNRKTDIVASVACILKDPGRTNKEFVERCQSGVSENEIIVDSVVVDEATMNDFIESGDM
jgi:hypothetical protein